MKFCLLPKHKHLWSCRAHSSLSSSQKKRVLSWIYYCPCTLPCSRIQVALVSKLKDTGGKKKNIHTGYLICMIVNFVYQFDWTTGCPDIWSNIILDVSMRTHSFPGPVAFSLLSLPPTPCLGAPILAQALCASPGKLHYFPGSSLVSTFIRHTVLIRNFKGLKSDHAICLDEKPLVFSPHL